MRVVLRDDVESLGKKGDLVDVADGYARNYLVPRGLAMKATRGVVQQAEAMRRNRDAREVRDRQAAEALVPQLAAKRIEVKARAGEGGKLFGSVTTTDIVAAVQAQTGIDLDRRKLGHHEAIKSVGTHEVPVQLHADVKFQITLEVASA